MPKSATKSELSRIAVEYVSAHDLKPAEYNPRKHDRAAEEKLMESIARFGMVDPIIVNAAPKRKNVVIGGHFRLKAAKSLGIDRVPVVYVCIPKLAKEKELNLRLNRNTGEWDWDLLKGFDVGMLADIGFDETDLSNIWDDALGIEDDGFDAEQEAGAIKKPTTRRGDLYRLGEHFLLCGDSSDPKDVARLMRGSRADMVYSDPPYNIALDYSNGIGTKGKYGGKTNDRRTPDDYRAFLKSCIENAKAVSQDAAHVFFWCDQTHIGTVQSLYGELGVTSRRVCLWIKNGFNVTPQVAFNKAYEPCVYGTVGSPYLNERSANVTEVLNREIAGGNRAIDDIIDLFDVWLAKRLPGKDYTHPTEKPPSLHEKALRRCTRPGGTVLDLFGGSGSTLAACEQMKRKAFLCEIDEIFCDVIIKRYEKLTGGKAKKVD